MIMCYIQVYIWVITGNVMTLCKLETLGHGFNMIHKGAKITRLPKISYMFYLDKT